MVEAALRALGQMDDRAFRSALWASILWTLLAFVGLAILAFLALDHWLAFWGAGWLGAALAVLATGFAAWLLFVPLAAGIATLYTERVAAAVEARWYPALPPGRPASLAAQAWDGVAVFLRLALAQLLLAVLLHTGFVLFLPWAGVLWLGLSGWAYARGLFVALAMRRLSRGAALATWRARRIPAIGVGILVALASLVPAVNLAAPLLGIAALVHVLERPVRDRVGWRQMA